MTATTAPVKSFDSLREGAVEVRVTRNRKISAATTQPTMMRMLLSTMVRPRETPRGMNELTPRRRSVSTGNSKLLRPPGCFDSHGQERAVLAQHDSREGTLLE